jgi:thioredoxin 1
MSDSARRHRLLPLLLTLASSTGLLLLPGCGQRLPPIDGNEVTITAENFDAEVVRSELPVLLDFWAEWCGPCRQLEPVVAHLSVNYDGRLKVGKVNIDEQQELAERFEVAAIPMLVLLQDGEVIATQTGSASLPGLSAWVDRNLPAGTTGSATQAPGPTGDQL